LRLPDSAESRAQLGAFSGLHQHKEDEEKTDKNVDDEQ
jgi:hypothetical protein